MNRTLEQSIVPFPALHAMTWAVLERPDAYAWTMQGFGFIRTYLDAEKRWRLNVWDSELATGASLIHDHPWHFKSYIIAGCLSNYRYTEDEKHGDWYQWTLLVPGIHGGLISTIPQGLIALRPPFIPESYGPGQTYEQKHREIHHTAFLDGTVTLNDRSVVDKDVARVFWPAGEAWKDAKPCLAKDLEVERAVAKARDLMEKGQ